MSINLSAICNNNIWDYVATNSLTFRSVFFMRDEVDPNLCLYISSIWVKIGLHAGSKFPNLPGLCMFRGLAK